MSQWYRNHVHWIPGAKRTEQQVMSIVSVVINQHECGWKSLRVSKWFRIELLKSLELQNLKSRLEKCNWFTYFN